MQYKNDAITGREAFYAPLQIHSIDGSGEHVVARADVLLGPVFLLRLHHLVERDFREPLLAQAHPPEVPRKAMQQGGERRLASEGADLGKQLKKSLLRRVFSLGRFAVHAQTGGIPPPL